jgi:endonuclease/exonuclease/phosphatase family metal-dependent hydrolase
MARLFALLLALLLPLSSVHAQGMQELKVMTFNIWVGGDQVAMTKTLEAIEKSGAEVVLLQEPMGNTQKIAAMLGWPYASSRLHIISKYPLFDAQGVKDAGGDFAYVELRPGRFVAVADVHLDWTDYGPYKAREGATAEEILATEQALRQTGIQSFIDALEPLASANMPVILGGDFNSPSSLDWTEATVGSKPHIKFPLVWPASNAMIEAGYADSYRTVYPDPLADPGVTWSTGYPEPYQWENETEDRIDLLFARNAQVTASQLIGESGAPDVDIVVDPWASDHHAVVSTFSVVALPGPSMIVAEPRGVTQGEPVVLRFNAAGTPDGRIESGTVEVLPSGAEAGKGNALAAMITNDTTDRFAVIEAATYKLEPGVYDAALVDGQGAELARTSFTVLSPGSVPTIAVDKASYAPGETIVATIAAAPGNRFDWVAVYKADSVLTTDYWTSAYTGSLIDGQLALDEAALGGPLEPGQWVLRLLRDDSYNAIAESAVFTVGP